MRSAHLSFFPRGLHHAHHEAYPQFSASTLFVSPPRSCSRAQDRIPRNGSLLQEPRLHARASVVSVRWPQRVASARPPARQFCTPALYLYLPCILSDRLSLQPAQNPPRTTHRRSNVAPAQLAPCGENFAPLVASLLAKQFAPTSLTRRCAPEEKTKARSLRSLICSLSLT